MMYSYQYVTWTYDYMITYQVEFMYIPYYISIFKTGPYNTRLHSNEADKFPVCNYHCKVPKYTVVGE